MFLMNLLGIPVAWMLASSGTEETIGYFLRLVRERNPTVIAKRIMSDRDLAQINGCRRWYPELIILLCWWHVLHAWQAHFFISKHPKLWEKLKAWIRLQDVDEFNCFWTEIQTLAPPDFVAYLAEYWMDNTFRPMWSAVFRTGRTVFEVTDTNMLVEA